MRGTARGRNGVAHPRTGPDDPRGATDAVLVDAPCTGSGTWRRRPDAKWRLRESALEVRAGEQDAVLEAASAFLRPGGRLVFVTCSVLAPECTDRLAAHLRRHPDHEPVPVRGLDPALDAAHWREDALGGAVLSPGRTGTDGFYVGVVRRG